MIFSALCIHFIVLLITLMSGSALALNDAQKTMLKQLTFQEYEELDQKLEEKNLYAEAESYVNRAMSAIQIRKREKFFATKNRKIAKQMGIKATNKTAKYRIPYRLLRTFNLVQAMIRYNGKVKIKNSAASVVTHYVDRLLSETGSAEQQLTEDIAWIEIFLENRFNKPARRIPIKTFNNKESNLLTKYLNDNIFYRRMHLLRNGEFVFTNVDMIRQVNLKDGDKIISPYIDLHPLATPIKNPATRAREIYIAVNRLQAFLDKQYPEKFSLSINEKNMLEVLLFFIVPCGWWQDAFFIVVFNFGNLDKKEPEFNLSYAPNTPFNFCFKHALEDTYQKYKKSIFDLHSVWPDNFSLEHQILNIINYVADETNTTIKHFFSRNLNENSPEDTLIEEIINSNNQAEMIFNPPIFIETDPKMIERNFRKITKNKDNLFFDYLVTNELKSESISTDIFMPVKMYNQAEIVELKYTSVKNFYDLIYEARRKSGFIIPKNIEPTFYYKNKKIDKHNVRKVLNNIKKRNTKSKKNHDILTVIVNVPGYEKPAFKEAKHHLATYYIPENSCHFIVGKCINKRVKKSEVRKPIKWEIHLFENKKLAKATNMPYQYKLILPLEPQKTTERYRGGTTLGGPSNVWIPTVRDDMSEVQKRFTLMAMYDLSRYKFSIPNNLKKASVSILGNDIFTKALLTTQDDEWLLSQVHFEFLLQRIKMSLLISHEDYSVAQQHNAFFESVINGTIDENVIEDLALFLPHLTPGLSGLSRMDSQNKTGIIYRIILNYLIELCVRTLSYNELDASSGITQQLIEKPEEFSLNDLYAANQQGFSVAFDVLKIVDFLFTKTLFNPLYKKPSDLVFNNNEIRALLLDINNMHKSIDAEENLIPLFLNHLLPTARHYSGDLDFESKEFLNNFTLRILENYGNRTKNKKVKASLLAFLKNTEQKSDFFSKEKTDKLIASFRENIPELLANVPNGKGGFRQTCYRCDEVYETKSPIRGKGRTTNRATGKPKKTLVRPFHEGCMKEDKDIRKQAGQLFKEMEKGYPKKQFFEPDDFYNPVPTGFELIRINGDGNCMYSSIAEIFNRTGPSGKTGIWNQQTVRQIMDYNLRRIYSAIQNHPDQQKLMQELGLLSGIDADLIQAVLDEHIITDSASTGQSELGRLQQFGDAQLMTLLVPTQGVWFPVITQGDYGSYHEIYDLRRWVQLAPNLLAMLLRNEDYRFPDLTENQRETLLQLLSEQNFDQAEFFISQTLLAPHLYSAYLIHYPSSVALLEHFDAAVNIEAVQSMEVDPPQTAQVDEVFDDLSHDENSKRIKLDPASSSISSNETASETLQDSNPLWLMIQAIELTTTPVSPTKSL
ncbi:hypothetical protein [Endozoicomonas sp. 4G]|uniref:hypothetical protein n=1 Tax=Endozoicomonas sp. 4G TaxID=2872754 RepID=UPI00207914C9|nr:hypothetical protein [Endozoicomonas sp. 4G]